MKKKLLTIAIASLATGAMAQNGIGKLKANRANIPGVMTSVQKNNTRCATPIPSNQWDAWFNQKVEEFKATLPAGKASSTTYTIPIIFHIIKSSSEAVGTGHNVSQAQVNSQVPILNADYAGTGYNTSLYAAMTYSGQPAFYQFAAAATNSVSAASKAGNGSIAMADCGITFCLATKNVGGTTLAEPGIDRVSWQSIAGASDPATQNQAGLQSLFDNTIKPATIWDATKYFNVWVSDGGTSGLLGYATFPAGTGLSGLSGTGTASTDGVWMAYNALGNTGAAASPYNKGRTLTHESGHWLGLRHIWGDGNCLTDYCNDTPPAAAANFVNCGTAYPYHAGTCSGPPSNSPDGEMYMNFMDYSNDCGMWMFTTDQKNRIQTSMANGTYRIGLTTSAANLCNITVSTPTAAFTPPSNICAGAATVFTDASSGPPTTWNWSVSPSAGVTVTTSGVSNPSITFASAGTYTVTDAVSNTAGSNSVSHTVTVTSCTASVCDTLSNVASGDTITVYNVNSGYLSGNGLVTAQTGTVTYTSKIIGEVYNKSSFPTNITQVKGAMLVIYRDATNNIGTKGSGSITVKMTNTGLDGSGAMIPGTTTSATQTVSLTSIVAAPNVAGVDYMGNNVYNYTGYMKAFPVMFASPVTMGTTFGLTITLPTAAGDTLVVWSNDQFTTNTVATGCIQLKPSNSSTATWYNVNSAFAIPLSFGIIPIACPSTSGIENNELGSNITLYPNPSNGTFNFAVTMTEATTLNFTVVNTLGQSVFAKTERVGGTEVIAYDLSSLGKGVYFVNITDGKNNKTVKKIIID